MPILQVKGLRHIEPTNLLKVVQLVNGRGGICTLASGPVLLNTTRRVWVCRLSMAVQQISPSSAA